MVNLKKFFDNEEIVIITVGIIMLWLEINFKSGLGLFYFAGVVIYYLVKENAWTYKIFKNKNNPNWKEALLIGGIYALGYLFIVSAAVSALQPYLSAKTLGQGFATNFFEGNPLISFLTGSILIGTAESLIFCGVLLPLFMRIFNPKMGKKITLGLMIAFVLTGVVFSAFHVTAYHAATAQLLSAGIFMFGSAIIAYKREQLAEIIISHILVNGILILLAFKLISLAVLGITFA